jgi:hypothetical protein
LLIIALTIIGSFKLLQNFRELFSFQLAGFYKADRNRANQASAASAQARTTPGSSRQTSSVVITHSSRLGGDNLDYTEGTGTGSNGTHAPG